jgi:prepilin-type N-terminal cleavage/methylation domain-containing protein
MSPRRRAGFTILELMVALALSAGVLLAGRMLTEQVAAIGDTIALKAAVADSGRVRARALRAIVRNIEIATDSANNFAGDARTAKFVSWCTGSDALKVRCAVALTADSVVTLKDPSGSLVVLRDTVPGVLYYLGDARDGGHWLRTWGPGVDLPLAIGIVFRADTTVLRIGDRG